MKNKQVIGVMGRGFVGNAVAKWFTTKQYTVKSYDTLYSTELRGYDYSALHEVLQKLDKLEYKGLVVVKSTTQPKTVINLQHLYNLEIVHNPEFLTARTSEKDFANQSHTIF